MIARPFRKSNAPSDKEQVFLVALVDSNLPRRNSFRQQLDVLGYASLAFDSPHDLIVDQFDPLEFGCMIIASQDEFIHSQIQAAMEKYKSPMLLVTAKENFPALSVLEKFFSESNRVDVIHESCTRHELSWRLHFLKHQAVEASASIGFFNFGKYSFDLKRRTAWVGEEKIHLKPLEFDLSLEFFQNINSVLTREKLYAQFWGESPCSTKSRKLDVCISNVRKKMHIDADKGLILRSIYGRGYELNSLDSEDGI
ncbi:winged helix-turn-helix domain-containing protein [Variovorax sp. ZS18.2.2]|uniref:winged helix-turn-helix domain-containing protein n=1 Tax=Variovorax sp. ZS18.2.2 TaxID=2971255 RepID=UPI002151E2B6|nr:winged helix-turn-helix domain-containing protein [Variovorax sp. ZS18.2.2]MCR6476281.1 winged helix-turn-helix domain-containing protein [Variovorax sp. ZS18.2.2]